jgi:hypothetical protein
MLCVRSKHAGIHVAYTRVYTFRPIYAVRKNISFRFDSTRLDLVRVSTA